MAPVALAAPSAHNIRSLGATRADSVTQAVQLDGPAVVRIISVVNATLICHGCVVDSKGKVTDIISPATGAFTYEASGSGAFITPTGDVLTADHVVDHSASNPEDVAFIEQTAAQDIAQQTNGKTTATAMSAYFLAHPSQVQIQTQVPFQKVYLSTDYTGQLSNVGQVITLPITGVAASSPVTSQDTAIVHTQLSGIPDVPYLPIAPPNSVNVGDTVTAIAFPADADNALGNADFTALLTPSQSDPNTISSLLGPSVNTGQVTSKKIRSDGSVIYETSGIASQGSSGGPVIDDQGQIIGFVDATPSTGTDRLTFLIASDEILTYTKQAGDATPATGHFMTVWRRALSEFNGAANCHYHSAATDFATLQQDYPKFGAVQQLVVSAQQKRATETCATPSATSSFAGGTLALVGGILAALLPLVLVVVGLLYLLRRRRRPSTRPQPAPTGAAPGPSGAYGPYSPSGAYGVASGPYSPAPYGGGAPGVPGMGAAPPTPTGAPAGQAFAPSPQPPYPGQPAMGQPPYLGQPGQPGQPGAAAYPGQPGSAAYPAPGGQPPYQPPFGAPGAAQPGQRPPNSNTPPNQRPFNTQAPPTPGQPGQQPYVYPPQPAPFGAAPGGSAVVRSAPQQIDPTAQPTVAQSPASPAVQLPNAPQTSGANDAKTVLRSQLRYCPNGHRVTDVAASACPVCGAPLPPVA